MTDILFGADENGEYDDCNACVVVVEAIDEVVIDAWH